MKRLFCIIAFFALTIQPLFAQQAQPQQSENPPAAPAAKPKTPSETQASFVAIEELLPAETIAFGATSNLSGLIENYKQLDALKVLQARLPKAAGKDNENPVTEALRYLSFGLEDAHELNETRVGFAVIKPDMNAERTVSAPPPPPSSKSVEVIEVGKTETINVKTGETHSRIENIGEVRDSTPPLVVAFIESPNAKSATKAREQFITFFSDNFEDLGKPSEIKQATRNGVKVDRFKNGYIGTFIGSTYLLGDPAAIDKVLEIHHSRDAARLSDKTDFARARSQMLSPSGLFAYLNSEPLIQMIGPSLAQMMQPIASMQFLLSDVKAMRSAAYASTFDREGVVDRLILNFDQSNPSLLKTIFSGPALEMKSVPMIPSGTSIVWTHSVDWTVVYDNLIVPMVFKSMAQFQAMREVYAEIEKERQEREKQIEEKADNQGQPLPPPDVSEDIQSLLRKGPDPQKLEEATQALIAQYEKDLGYKMRNELAKDFGNELAVAYDIPKLTVNAQNGKRENGGAVLIGIRDREAARNALLRLLTYTVMKNLGNQAMAGGAPAQIPDGVALSDDEKNKQQPFDAATAVKMALTLMPREVYKKAEILSVMSFAAIAFTDDFVIFADGKETIKQLLDTTETGASMLVDSNYRRATGGGNSTHASQLYITPKYFDEELNQFLNTWADKRTVQATDMSAFPLSVPTTATATVEKTDSGLQIEAFSPLGIPGMFAFDQLANSYRARTSRNENNALENLRQIARAEKSYAKTHQGNFVSLDLLAKEKLDGVEFDFARLKEKEPVYSYELKLKANRKGFEATATPVKYGRQGRLSFFIDESGKIRQADKQGEPATAQDDQNEEHDEDEEKDDSN